jgi:hypothetical protein
MTIGGKIVSFFPLFYLICVLAWMTQMFLNFQYYQLLVLVGIVYLMPLLFHRLHCLFFPFGDGYWILSEKKYNPWWASHMFQFPFIACPWIESLLHFVPGLFSIWLRCWGSKIGKNVYWTPRVEVVDRGLMEVGSNVVVGHISGFCSHMVADIDGKPALVVKKIILGDRVFVGGDTQMGPGAIVPPRTKLKPKTRLYWRGEWHGTDS